MGKFLEVIDFFYKVFLNESTVSVVDAVVKTELVNSAADPRVTKRKRISPRLSGS